MIPIDLHTHTIASGHGSFDTIADMAKEAAARGLSVLGISDHGPATPGAASVSYFRSLAGAPRERCGIRLLYGVEVNILEGGTLDLPDDALQSLDFCIASMHCPPRARHTESFSAALSDPANGFLLRESAAHVSAPEGYQMVSYIDHNTADYLRALSNPLVRILGHCDNTQFPVDYGQIADAAAEYGTIIEVNEASLTPGGYHQIPGVSTHDNYRRLLLLCRERQIPILLSSDTHGRAGIGRVPFAEALVREIEYPEELIVNFHLDLLLGNRS